MTDDGFQDKKTNFEAIKPSSQTIAVAVKDYNDSGISTPHIKAAARGALAEKILKLAFENDIKVRKDSDLAEMLAELELDSPIPTEALTVIAEILSYVYRANGEPDPFNAILDDDK